MRVEIRFAHRKVAKERRCFAVAVHSCTRGQPIVPSSRRGLATCSSARRSRKAAQNHPACGRTFDGIDSERLNMVRTIEYFLIASLVVGIIATPGLGAIALLLVPFLVFGFVWRSAVTVVTRGRPSEAVVRTRRSHLLGPGGPDDLFAAGASDEGEYPAATPATSRVASADASNSLVQCGNVLRPSLAGLRPASQARFRDEV